MSYPNRDDEDKHHSRCSRTFRTWLLRPLLTHIDQRFDQLKEFLMAQIDDLKAQLSGLEDEVAQQTTIEQSAITLLTQLHDMLAAIEQAPDLQSAIDQVAAVREKLSTDRQALVDSVTANTPAAQP